MTYKLRNATIVLVGTALGYFIDWFLLYGFNNLFAPAIPQAQIEIIKK